MRVLPSRRAALALALTLLAGVVSAGCGDATGSKAAGSFTPRTPGVLTVATEQVPAAGFWEGTPQHLTGGFAYELAKHLATRFGLDRVRVRVIPFDRIVAGKLGGADLAMSLITPTEEREQVLDFSAPYLDAAPTILVRSGTDVPDLKTARELRWGAQRATTLVSTTQDAIDPETPRRIYEDQDALLSALRGGRIEAALFDLPAAVAFAKQSGGRLAVAAQLPGVGDDRGGTAAGFRQPRGGRFGHARVHLRRHGQGSARALGRSRCRRSRAERPAPAHDAQLMGALLQSLPLGITLTAPEGPAWDFLVLFAVVILGPPLVTRARVPGIIGLLLGGFLIGPHGLGWIGEGNTTVPELGQLGLLYLMFVAGVELDLAILRVHRRSAITFGIATFAFPMTFGTIAGFALGWDAPACSCSAGCRPRHAADVPGGARGRHRR